jgi:Ca2+-binding RTX toxin-like protein
MANDHDPDGDPVTFDFFGSMAEWEFHGIKGVSAVTNNTNPNIGYAELHLYEGFEGEAYVAYFIIDGNGNRSKGYIYVTVAPPQPNRAPVANDDVASTNAGQAFTIPVLANDSDADGDTLSVSIPSGMGPTHGTITVNANGTISYTATAGYSGSDSFTYRVTDPEGLSDTASVVITVQRAPDANNDSVVVDELVATDIAVRANDSDPDGHPLTITSVSTPAHGTATINANGTIRYTPTSGYLGPDSFTYTISDGHGGTDTATVSITVAAVDDPPIALNDSTTVNEDSFVDIAVKANDTDPDSVTLTVTAVGTPAHGTTVINANGTVRYTPAANYNGLDSFTYTLSDGNSTDTATVNITVNAVNDPPVAADDAATTNEDVAFAIPVLANDTDPDGAATLTVSALGAASHGTVTINPNGTIQYVPHLNYNGTDSFTYTLSDGAGGTDTGLVTVTLNPVNDMPTPVADARLMNENSVASIDVRANDTDVDGDPLTVSAVGAAANGTTAINPDGTVRYTPNADWFGVDSFNYTISDGAGGSTQAIVTVTVNNLPEAIYDRALTFEDMAVAIQVIANDIDLDGDALVVSSVTHGANGSVSIGAGGTVNYTPNLNFFGTDTFTYVVSDGRGGSDTETVTVTVEEVVDDGELLVNQILTGEQDETTIAALADGGYVVVFHHYNLGDVYARRFGADGLPAGNEFRVNTHTTGTQSDATVTALADGGFVVVYYSRDVDAGYDAVAGQRFDANGMAVGSEFLVGSSNTTNRSGPSVGALADGGFVVAYNQGTRGFVQQYNADGTPEGSAFDFYGSYNYGEIAVTGLSDGGYVLSSWTFYTVNAQIRNADGTLRTATFTLPDNSANNFTERRPALADLPNGGFVATWESSELDGSRTIVARIFSATGVPLTDEFIVNTVTAGTQHFPSVASFPDGRFIINWSSSGEEGDSSGQSNVYAQIFSAEGVRIGSPFRVNETIDGSQTNRGYNGSQAPHSPTVAVLADGTIAFSWWGNGEGDPHLGSTEGGTYTRRFTAEGLIVGTPGNDMLISGKGHDVVQGAGGNDTLSGMLGNDQLIGGDGHDLLLGGPGADSIDGGAGNDTASYASAPVGVIVSLAVSTAQNTIGAGIDTLAGIENLTGSAWADQLTGYNGDNVLVGGSEADVLDGGAGADRFVYLSVADSPSTGPDRILNFQSGMDKVDLGALAPTSVTWIQVSGPGGAHNLVTVETESGPMTIRIYGAITIDDFILSTFNEITGSAGADNLTGTPDADLIDAKAGNDVLRGEAGNDRLIGGTGTDMMEGGLGNDIYVVDNIGDQVVETAAGGIDKVESSIVYTLGNNVEDLLLLAGALNGTGNGLANTITGNGANNILNGMGGADAMAGGGGHDTYVVNVAGDTVAEGLNGGNDTVESSVAFTLGDNVEYLTLTGTGTITGTGNALNNIINGNDAANFLNGGIGADFMTGGGGDDTYFVDNASDKVTEGAGGGVDTVNSTVNYTLGAEIERLVLGGTASLQGIGNDIANIITGNAAANILNGGIGADAMQGGLGNDTYIVDNVGDVTTDTGGVDTVQSSVTVTLHASIDNLLLTGTAAIDGTGNGLWNVMTGNSGANTLDGGVGNDILNGGFGADTLIGGVGHDTYHVDDIGDVVTDTGGGNDHVHASIDYVLGTDLEYLTLTGTAVSATGNAKNNLLYGNAGNNIIDGGLGADFMVGGMGDDTYYVENGSDQITEHLNQGTDTVMSSVHHALRGNIENLTLIGTNAVSATGNELANVITGNSANNVLSGGLGADTLSGGGGNDTYQYRFITDSTAAAKDQISGFNAGDKINLSLLDANTGTPANNDAFTFIGANAFSNTAGELRATETGGVWTIEADVNGDGLADLVIGLTTEDGYLIGAADFIL